MLPLNSIKQTGHLNLAQASENAIDKAKNVGSSVIDKAEAVASNVVHNAENFGSAVAQKAEAAQHAAVKAAQCKANLVRFAIEKSFNNAEKIVNTAGKTIVKNLNAASHPGSAHPPSAQGLKFSETKSACDLAYKANRNEIYKFPDGKLWKVVDVENNTKTGFRSIALQSVDPGDKRVIVAYAGSCSNLKDPDWQNNFKQAAGFAPDQYKEAANFAGKWKAAAGHNVILTGHSLGGGLAAYASIKTGLHATAVNAAPLALTNLGLKPTVTKRITQYYVPGEALSVLNKVNLADVRPGAQIAVRGKDSIYDARSVVSNHGLSHVVPSIPVPQKQ